MSLWWSFVLTVFGAAGYLLVVRGHRTGMVVGLALQLVWTAYAVVSAQWWFLVSVVLFTAVNSYGLWSSRKPRVDNPPP